MYQHGKIYKVVDNGYNLCYYGSTVQPLSKRFSTHKKDYVRYRDGRKERPLTICKIFDEYGVDNCKIELVELFPCNSKEELHKREGEHIRNNDCVNKFIPGRSKEEYRKGHKAENAARMRKCRSKLTDEQKEVIKQKQKEWKNQHKEELKARRAEKVVCDVCGSCYGKGNKSAHEKTKKHQDKLQEPNEI